MTCKPITLNIDISSRSSSSDLPWTTEYLVLGYNTQYYPIAYLCSWFVVLCSSLAPPTPPPISPICFVSLCVNYPYARLTSMPKTRSSPRYPHLKYRAASITPLSVCTDLFLTIAVTTIVANKCIFDMKVIRALVSTLKCAISCLDTAGSHIIKHISRLWNLVKLHMKCTMKMHVIYYKQHSHIALKWMARACHPGSHDYKW